MWDFPERKINPKYYTKKWMLLLCKSNMKSLYSIWHGWNSSKFCFVVQIVQCQIWLLNIPFLCFGNKMGVIEVWAGVTPLIPPQKHLYPRHTSFSGVTAVLRVLKEREKINKYHCYTKKTLQQDINWVMKCITGSALVLSEFLFQKQVNIRNIELGGYTKTSSTYYAQAALGKCVHFVIATSSEQQGWNFYLQNPFVPSNSMHVVTFT